MKIINLNIECSILTTNFVVADINYELLIHKQMIMVTMIIKIMILLSIIIIIYLPLNQDLTNYNMFVVIQVVISKIFLL